MDQEILNQVWKKQHDTAAIVHAFYVDLVDELAGKLKNLGAEYDLYITAPKNNPQLLSKLSKTFPNATVIPFINKGRDVLPFIEIIKKILPLNYRYLVKVHTKLSTHMAFGNNWRQDLFEKLLGTPELVKSIKEAFMEDPKLGLLGPEGHVVESRFYMGGNYPILEKLMPRFNYSCQVPENFFFTASTMFWCRPEVFKPFLDVEFLPDEFGEEPIPADDTLAHGLERFFGLMTTLQDYKIKTINEEGGIAVPNPHQTIRFVGLPTAFRLQEMSSLLFFRSLRKTPFNEQFRISRPYRLAGIDLMDGVSEGNYSPEQVNHADALILQGSFDGSFEDYSNIYNAAIKYHKPIILDVDELFFNPHNVTKDHSMMQTTFKAMLDADLLITATPKLKETLALFNPNITVFPSYLDEQVWKLKDITPKENEVVRLGFIGNGFNQADLDVMAPVLMHLLAKHAPMLQLVLINASIPKCLEDVPGVTSKTQSFQTYKEYADFCYSEAFDILISPMVDNIFNACKSPLRFFEQSAMGVPGVYSAMEPYKNTIVDGVDGFLASNPSEWMMQLEALILNPNLRLELAINAQEKLKKHFLLSNNIHSLQGIFGETVPDLIVDRASKTAQSSYLQKIIPILMQARLSSNNEDLLVELERTKDELQFARNDIEEYKSSTSWRITRPLRKLSDLLKKK